MCWLGGFQANPVAKLQWEESQDGRMVKISPCCFARFLTASLFRNIKLHGRDGDEMLTAYTLTMPPYFLYTRNSFLYNQEVPTMNILGASK